MLLSVYQNYWTEQFWALLTMSLTLADVVIRPALRGGEVPDLGGVGSCEICMGSFITDLC